MKDYRKLCLELFGTDDENELRAIAGRMQSGRKKALTEQDLQKIIELQRGGKTTNEIAEIFGVSRQTISKYLNKQPDGDWAMRLDFMFRQKVCTEIYVDFIGKRIKIINRTDDIMKRAFGKNEKPTWQDFEEFLEDRCMPRSRAYSKTILRRIGLDNYDTLRILEATKGRTADDNQYINFTYRKGMAF